MTGPRIEFHFQIVLDDGETPNNPGLLTVRYLALMCKAFAFLKPSKTKAFG